MVKNFKLLIITALAVFLANCEKNDVSNSLRNRDVNRSKRTEFTMAEQKVLMSMRNGKENKIGIDEATQIANDVIGFLDDETVTKSGNSKGTRHIASMVALRGEKESKVKTKAGSNDGAEVEMPDTLAYLFNFADNSGFTIIAADTRVANPVLCYTGSGTLGDTITNPGIAVFLVGAEYYIKAIDKPLIPDDPVMITTTTTYTEYSPHYIHNNWGNYDVYPDNYYGASNGYFVAGSFDEFSIPALDSNTKSGTGGNYQYNINIYPHIYK